MDTAVQITPLVLSYADLLLELAKGHATMNMLENALFFPDCSKEYFFNESCALEKLNAYPSLDERQKRMLHRLLCSAANSADEGGRALWRSGSTGTWGELNWLLQLNGLPEVPTPFYDHMPVLREYSPACVALSVRRRELPYQVFPYQAI